MKKVIAVIALAYFTFSPSLNAAKADTGSTPDTHEAVHYHIRGEKAATGETAETYDNSEEGDDSNDELARAAAYHLGQQRNLVAIAHQLGYGEDLPRHVPRANPVDYLWHLLKNKMILLDRHLTGAVEGVGTEE